jgi:hypothetical protein
VSRRPTASRSSSSASSGGARGVPRSSDGKVTVDCPGCGAQYRLPEDDLDERLECGDCHQTFLPRNMLGRRARPKDNTKTYMIFGAVAVAIVGVFAAMSMQTEPVKKPPPPPVERRVVFTPGTHPRTLELIKWAQAMGSDNRLVIKSHSDWAALATAAELPASSDEPTLFEALRKTKHKPTKFLRLLLCESGTLHSEAMMEAPSGTATLYLVPKPGDVDFKKNTRCELKVAFSMDGPQIKVASWEVTMEPARLTLDPDRVMFTPNKDIEKPQEVEITDGAGTRKVMESKVSAIPHWEKATPEQKTFADQVVADVLASADDNAPASLFNRATQRVQSLEEKKAVVPRILNAMYELYGDVNGNNMKLSQLDRALRGITGWANNYDTSSTGDEAKDKAARESCVRQWFAFWWRYSAGELSDFIDDRESLEEPLDPKAKKGR